MSVYINSQERRYPPSDPGLVGLAHEIEQTATVILGEDVAAMTSCPAYQLPEVTPRLRITLEELLQRVIGGRR